MTRWRSGLRAIGAAALLAVLCGACGFEPLYGRREVVDALATVAVEPITEWRGLILRTYLRDALDPRGASPPARYRLRVVIQEARADLLLRGDQFATRATYSGAALYTLLDGDQVLTSGSASFQTNFEIDTSQFATLSSRTDAQDRVMRLISEDIRNQLATFFLDRANRAQPRSQANAPVLSR
jgi:LPS-assembly lipoprotein